jgi:hypothetical protein
MHTEIVANTGTFQEFVLECASSIRKLPLNTIYKELLEKYKEDLEAFKKLSDKDIDKLMKDDYNKQMLCYTSETNKVNELRKKYVSMLEKVKAWKPPTKEHMGLKSFMKKRLTESIKYDCDTILYQMPIKMSIGEYKCSKIFHINEVIRYCNSILQENVGAVDENKVWLKALKDSIEDIK